MSDDVCAQPEVAALRRNGTTCADAFECFAKCNDQYDVITSMRMRQCFLGDADFSQTVAIDSVCTYTAGALAYDLAQRYRGSSVSVAQARTIMREQLIRNSGRRLEAAPTAFASLSVDTVAVATAAAPSAIPTHGVLRRRLVGAVLAATLTTVTRGGEQSSLDALIASSVPPRRHLVGVNLTTDQALAEAYHNTAVGAALALVTTGRLATIMAWVATIAFIAMLPPIVGLRGLGATPPRCCEVPTHVERMHKVSMRCACHCSYLWGITILLVCALGTTKLQILARYATEDMCVSGHCASSSNVPSAWNYGSIGILLVPCVLGIVAGVLPIFYAMILSRSRAERREAKYDDVPLKMYKQNESKHLSAPQPVLMGPPPNLAMLNPMLDADDVGIGVTTTSERVEQV